MIDNLKKDQLIRGFVLFLCLAALVVGLRARSLWPPDEQREAEIAREMAVGSSWIVPHLAGRPFVEKPPLYYWTSAFSMKTLGRLTGPTAAARTVSVLCAILTLVVVFFTVKRYLGNRRAFEAVLVLASMVGFFDAAHKVLIDPLLMLLTTSSVLLLFVGLESGKTLPLLSGYLIAGLAFLAKGFIGWVLIGIPGIALGLLYFQTIRRNPFLHLAGLLLLLLPGLAWAAAFYSRGGELLWREWFIDNQIGRFTGMSTHLGHIKGPFYYGEMLPLALLPWTPALVAWIVHRGWRRWTEGSTGSRNLLRVVAVWSFGSLLFLSLAGTKRNIYLFPLLPAFAVMASVYMEKPALWLKAVLRGITVLLLPGAIYLSFFSPASPAAKFPWGWNLNIFALISALAGIYIFRAARKIILVRLAGITAVVFLVYQFTIMPVIDMKKTYRPMVERLTAAIPEGERGWVLGWDTDERTLGSFAFYGGIYLSEIADPARLASILRGDDEACRLVITRQKHFPPGEADFPDYRVISRGEAEGRDYLLISGSAK